jgi:hypothetical protein
VTFFGLVFTPVFYVVIRKLTSRRKPAPVSRIAQFEPVVAANHNGNGSNDSSNN